MNGSEQSSKAGRKEQSYRQSRNVRQTKDNHGSSQDRNSPNDAPILLIGDSIIKNIDPWKMSRRRTVKICLPGKRAEQITAEVKSIPVINPSHVIIHAGTNNVPTDSEYECIKHVEDLAKCTKARFPDAKVTRLARLTSAGSRKFCLRLLGCQPGCTIVYGRLKICAHYQGTGSRIFSDEKLPKLHSIPSILLNLPF